jgi:uncharacterized membrane protein YphA (DoxX/SURF4 family)
MKTRRIVYWVCTAVTAFVFLSGGIVYLMGVEGAVKGVMELGYPAYFVTMLGVWKVLGGIVILLPGMARVKEWAYAGMAFDLIGAAVSSGEMGKEVWHVVVPLVILGIVVGSWGLRPAGRRLRAASGPMPFGE